MLEKVRLGRTDLMVTRTAFGALPIQRISAAEAGRLLRRAFDAGINFFDTARAYSDSEEKIGLALADVRQQIVIASKSGATTKSGLLEQLETSLRNLRTDYIDILQLHNPAELPDPADPESSYAGLLEAKRQGMIRFIGFTNHRLDVARSAIESGQYDTLQYPLSPMSSADELALAQQCQTADMGLIAMKALCGGLVTNAAAAFAFMRQFANVVPIWGLQRMAELEEFLALESNPPVLDESLQAALDRDLAELSGDFCRGCGYCLPCPQDIPIPMAARMSLLLRRAPYQGFITGDWQEKMSRINQCTECRVCQGRCPYNLDAPRLLRQMLQDYEQFVAAHSA